jgi:hypothetical protein
MQYHACQKGEFDQEALALVREAVRAGAEGVSAQSMSVEVGPHFISIDQCVEIQPLLFDCRGLLRAPSFVIRRMDDVSLSKPCECGEVTRGSEIGNTTSLCEAVALAVSEALRRKILFRLENFTTNQPTSRNHVPKTNP